MTEALLCLALAVYTEARGEPIDGQRAVAQVVLNRARHDHTSVCDVVYAPKQFSGFNRGALTELSDRQAMATSVRVAREALSGKRDKRLSKATHFHSVSVQPQWSQSLVFVVQIGNHLFYRES